MADLDSTSLLAATRRLHEAIRARTGELLERARATGNPDLANAPGVWGAGDLSYALDEAAEDAVRAYAAELGARHPVTVIAEGLGQLQAGAGASGAPLRILIDPVDGTRSLMHDMRSAWALTGIAPDKGPATRLSDVQVAVQTELPTTTAGVYHVLTAVRGRGATIARHDARTGAELERKPLVAAPGERIDNGYLCFTRFVPAERTLIARLEARFLARIIEHCSLEPRLLYDDQYLCSAGQLFLTGTGRYRMLADLRGWLAQTRGLDNFTAKPYDLAALLVWQEAGVPVLDERGEPLDAPLDTESKLSVVAFSNESLQRRLWPHLREVMAGRDL